MKPFVVLDRASKSFGTRNVVSDCSFSIESGEVVGIGGPNGVGKSTVAKLLLGFSRPTAGTVLVDAAVPMRYRSQFGVGYAPEEADRAWSLSVEQFIGMRCGGRNNQWTPRRATDVLGLGALADRSIRHLSKGQWRLVLVAHALTGGSGLIVLDEPDSGLDPTALDRLQQAVREVSAEGSTVVILSHNLDELQRACNRIFVIDEGKLVASVSRDDLAHTSMRTFYRSVVTR